MAATEAEGTQEGTEKGSANKVDTSHTRPYFFTCDDLTPDLCEDLQVQTSQVEIQGINVTYWIYTSPSSVDVDAMESIAHSSDKSSTNAKERTNKKLPIVTIHGGPSFTHNYMLPLKQQACRGRPVVFYDQAGCGKSRIPSQDASTATDGSAIPAHLLDPLYYSKVELPALVDHLIQKQRNEKGGGAMFQNGYHIIGNSWGTMVAQLYSLDAKSAVRRQQLASMVLSGPFSDSQTYIQAQWDPVKGNLGTLPPFVQQRIHTLEAADAFTSDEYQAINAVLSSKFTIRTQPTPDCWYHAEQQANNEIYVAMQGPSEFTMSGVLANVNLTGRLPEIRLPVLLTHGKYDTMRPSIVKTMERQLPFAERQFFTRSGHVSMIDEPGLMNDRIAEFLDRVEVQRDDINSRSVSGSSSSGNFSRTFMDMTNGDSKNWWTTRREQQRVLDTTSQVLFPSSSASSSSAAVADQVGGTVGYTLIDDVGSVVVVALLALVIGFFMGEYRARANMRWHYTSLVGAIC